MTEYASDKDISVASDLNALEMYIEKFVRRVDECDIKNDFIEIIEEINKISGRPRIKNLEKELSHSGIKLRHLTRNYNNAKKKFIENCDCRTK